MSARNDLARLYESRKLDDRQLEKIKYVSRKCLELSLVIEDSIGDSEDRKALLRDVLEVKLKLVHLVAHQGVKKTSECT